MLNRRGFLGLFMKATLMVAAARIPLVSPVAHKIAVKHGWFAVTVHGKRYYIPYFK